MRRIYKNVTESLGKINGVDIVGPSFNEERSNIISITMNGKDIANLSALLSENGVEIRVGLHCSSMAHKSEGTYPEGTLRFSPGPFNTREELDFVLKIVYDFV